MRRCIALAQNGRYHAAPNPMVGCCIVSGGRIIGEGFHARCGEPHAEVNAIRSVRSADRERLKEHDLCQSRTLCPFWTYAALCAVDSAKRDSACGGGLHRPFLKGLRSRHRHVARRRRGSGDGSLGGRVSPVESTVHDGANASPSVHHAEVGSLGRRLPGSLAHGI